MAAKLKIVVSLLTDQQDFQRMQAEDARAAANRAGFDIDVLFADNNAILQIHQLFGYVHAAPDKRPVAIVVESAAAEGLERVARSATPEGIGWVLLSARAPYLEVLRKEYPKLIVSSATPNEEEVGRIQAKQFRALLPKGGSLLYIEGPSGNAGTINRRGAMENGIRGSNITLLKSLSADWTEAGAERVVSSWLRLKVDDKFRPDLLGAQNDTMAIGARKAILAQRKEWATIPVTGCDGLPDGGQQLVRQGVLAATVVKPPTAGKGVELVARHLRGEVIPPFTEIIPNSYPEVGRLGRPSQ